MYRKNKNIEKRKKKEKFIRMVDIMIICFAYMEATVVGGSVAERNQPAMVLFSN